MSKGASTRSTSIRVSWNVGPPARSVSRTAVTAFTLARSPACHGSDTNVEFMKNRSAGAIRTNGYSPESDSWSGYDDDRLLAEVPRRTTKPTARFKARKPGTATKLEQTIVKTSDAPNPTLCPRHHDLVSRAKIPGSAVRSWTMHRPAQIRRRSSSRSVTDHLEPIRNGSSGPRHPVWVRLTRYTTGSLDA